MTVNKWFSAQNNYKPEQDLAQSLVDEAIQIKGADVMYLVRTMENRDFLFGESPISSFKERFEVEMYLEQILDFNGDGILFNGISGMQMNDQAMFVVSTKRFKEESKKFDLSRPREGDLIYYPLSDSLFVIKKVKNDPDFKQLGKNYRYTLVTELFEYSYEEFKDGTEESDIVDFWTTKEMVGDKDILTPRIETMRDDGPLIDERANEYISNDYDPYNPFGGR